MNPRHWAAQRERGHRTALALTAWMVRCLPVWVVRIAAYLVCLYFYLTSPAARRHVRAYQQRLRRTFPQAPLPALLPVYRQFAAFGEAITDRFAVWQHKIAYHDLTVHDPDGLYADIRNRNGRGQILICSHLGNVEVCRALAGHHTGFVLNVLVHNRHAPRFNRALQQAGADGIRLIQVDELDAALMLRLAEKLDAGEWLAIAADRIPVRGSKTTTVPFLGEPAPFPQGAWLLAHLLRCPSNTLFLIKQNGRYQLMLRRFDGIPPPSRHRQAAIEASIARYANLLAEHAAQAPLQWFNFYDFWDTPHA